MERFLPVIIFLALVIAAYEYGYNRTVPNSDPNHTHADFAVWINGKQIDFAQKKYMTEELTAAQLEALSRSTATGSSIQVLKQYLHLHNMNGHVIHRHKPGLSLLEFFVSLGFGQGSMIGGGDCLMTGTTEIACLSGRLRLFVNKQEMLIDSPLDYRFQDNDALLITDSTDPIEVQHEIDAMTHDACKYSKTCPGRGPAPTESCISDPTIPCKAP